MVDVISVLSPLTTRIVAALLIIFVGFVVGRLVGLFLKRIFGEFRLDHAVKQAIGKHLPFEKVLSGLVSFVIYAATLVMALQYLGLTTVLLSVFTVAIIVVLAVSLLLALRDLLPNAFAGMTLRYGGHIRVDDHVNVAGVKGVVEEVGLLSTRIKTEKREMLIIPNALFQRQGYRVKNR